MEFNKYVFQFTKDTDKQQTHLSFNNGKYFVPDEHYTEFYREYYAAMKLKKKLFLIEKVSNSVFAFFMDLDTPKNGTQLTDALVLNILTNCNTVLKSLFRDECSTEYIVSKRENKYHVNYPHIIVNANTALLVHTMLSQQLEQPYSKCIDKTVYRTGLRMLGSQKKDQQDVQEKYYRTYDIHTGTFTELQDTSFDTFMKTVVRRIATTILTPLSPEGQRMLQQPTSATTSTPTSSQSKLAIEIESLLRHLKEQNPALQNFDIHIKKVLSKQNRAGMFCYYIETGERMCPFKGREHQRTTNPVYLELNMNKVYIRCHDEDCRRLKCPDEGIDLPSGFDHTYSQLYLSMNTRYYRSTVELTQDMRRVVEDSLCGSHYKIAKTIFTIYKDRFRVDDVKDSTWYEFDGIRWKKSNLMNILVSEEIPEYYKALKVTTESVQQQSPPQQPESNDSVMRNQIIDNITLKLENMMFKGSVIRQLSYLYQLHDSHFYQLLDSKPHLVGFKNGVYDFAQGTFRKATQQDYLTFSTGYDYIEYNETYPEVQEIYTFLSQIITNENVREYLLKVLGKALVGVPDEKFYIWTGLSGANGKSTLVNFLEATLGDYTTSVDVSLLTNKRGNSSNASPDIVRLRGKRIFTFQEPEHDDKLRTGILKQYTGGDTIIARELFKAPITFKLQGTMIMCCNDLPSVASIDGGTWRRIRVIEFNSRFTDTPVKPNEFKIDPILKSKMQGWKPYFMSILIHWYHKYKEEGLHEPDEVKTATARYKVENDKFNQFFDDCLEETGSFTSTKNIYGALQYWWTHNYPMTKTPDIKDLKRSLKIKYGSEVLNTEHHTKQTGFMVHVKSMAFTDDTTSTHSY